VSKFVAIFSFLSTPNKSHFVGVLLASFLASSCASGPTILEKKRADDIVNLVEEFPETDISTLTAKSIRDSIKIGDSINVRVFGQDDLSGKFVVDRSGAISFPLIGAIQVVSLNTMELRETLTAKYAESYLQNPNVSVDLEARSLGKVIVDGAVSTPGVYEIADVISLSEAIALSGGLTQDAKGDAIFIVRTIDGGCHPSDAINYRFSGS